MAERLRTSRKTFAALVDERDIPHIVVGRRKIFDPVAVEAHLAAAPIEKRDNLIQFQPKASRSNKKPKSRFAQAVGI